MCQEELAAFAICNWGQSYKSFYTLGWGKIKSLSCRLNDKEKFNIANMLGCCVLTL